MIDLLFKKLLEVISAYLNKDANISRYTYANLLYMWLDMLEMYNRVWHDHNIDESGLRKLINNALSYDDLLYAGTITSTISFAFRSFLNNTSVDEVIKLGFPVRFELYRKDDIIKPIISPAAIKVDEDDIKIHKIAYYITNIVVINLYYTLDLKVSKFSQCKVCNNTFYAHKRAGKMYCSEECSLIAAKERLIHNRSKEKKNDQ